MSEEEKVAMLGRPRLGETIRSQIRIKESKEFKVSNLFICCSTKDKPSGAVSDWISMASAVILSDMHDNLAKAAIRPSGQTKGEILSALVCS